MYISKDMKDTISRPSWTKILKWWIFFWMITKVQVGNLVYINRFRQISLGTHVFISVSNTKRCPNLPSICSVPFGALLRRRLRSSLKDQRIDRAFSRRSDRSWKVSNSRIIFLTGLKPPPKKVFVYNLFKAYFLYLETFLKHLLFFAPFLRVFSSRPKITGLRFPWNHRCSMSYWLTFFSLYGFITEVRFGVVMVILKLRGVWSFFFYCWGDLVEWYFLNETVLKWNWSCLILSYTLHFCGYYHLRM